MSKRYAIFKRGDQDAESDWFHHCQRNEMPFVVVRFRSSRADVEWDYINLPTSKDDVLHGNRELKTTLEKIYEGVATAKSSSHITDTTAIFYDLPISEAEKAATQLYEAVTSVVREA